MRASSSTAWIAALVGLACGACSDGSGPGPGTLARLEAFDDGLSLPAGGVIGVSAASLDVGEEGVVSELRFIDTGNRDLVITAIEVESQPLGAFRLAGDADGGALPVPPIVIAPESRLEGQRSVYVYLMLTRPPEGVTPRATIRVASNSVSGGGVKQPTIAYQVEVQSSAPTIQVTPRSVSFGTVRQGQTAFESIHILNPGGETLRIDSFTLSGHPAFELVVGATHYPVNAASAAGIVLEAPLAVEPGTSAAVSVLYTADDASPARGQVVFFSNDPTASAGTAVALQANVGGPCITVSPTKVAFGGKLIGKLATIPVEVTSCGTEPLELIEIGLVAGSAEQFSLSLDALPGVTGTPSALGPSDAPVVLAPQQKVTIGVEYFPDHESPSDAVGQPIYDLGTLRIRSNSFAPELLTELSGLGVRVECPNAVIIVQEGEEVIPQTRLHLIGSQSTAAVGAIATYHWEVDQPAGARSLFEPNDHDADPTFEVNAAGRYAFRLTVTDALGEASCVPATTEVFVSPNEALHVELLWDTPNDPDQTDEKVGADLDLHFQHPLANGHFDGDGDGKPDGWFDVPFDCFWANKQPDWGSLVATVDDNPGLDRDDTDGIGPENMNLNQPQAATTYKVGVHYWDDHDFGISAATVRVFIYGAQVFETPPLELFLYDMWWVTEIAWPPPATAPRLTTVCRGTLTACTSDAQCGAATCGPKIQPNYIHPEYFH